MRFASSGRGRVAREWILVDDDVDNPLDLKRASQKLITMAYLLQAMTEPSTPEGRNQRDEAWVLIEQVALQQAESSASRMRSAASAKAGGTAHQDHEASVHTPPGGRGKVATENGAKAPSVHDRIKKPSTKERLQDTRRRADDGDACNILNKKKKQDGEARGYHPRHGGRYDSEEDRSPSPEPLGTRVFSREIRTTPFPRAFVSPPPSSSTRGKPIPRSGSTTTAWHASWAARPTML